MARRFLSADASFFEQAQNITRSWDRLRVLKLGELDANPTQIFGQNIVSRHEAIDIVMQVSLLLRLFLFTFTSFTKQRAGFLWPWKYVFSVQQANMDSRSMIGPSPTPTAVCSRGPPQKSLEKFWAESGHILPRPWSFEITYYNHKPIRLKLANFERFSVTM